MEYLITFEMIYFKLLCIKHHFFILILYPGNVQNFLIRSNLLCVDFLGFSMKIIMSSSDSDNLFLLFLFRPVNIYLF